MNTYAPGGVLYAKPYPIEFTRVPPPRTKHGLGHWFVEHYRAAAAERGVQSVAKQLRKQGVPINVTRALLLRELS